MLRNIKRRLSVGKIKKRIVGGYNGDHVSLSIVYILCQQYDIMF